MQTENQPAAQVPVWNLANIITMARIALVPVFVLLMVPDSTAARLGALAVFLVAAATDKLDGHIARSRGLVTSFGKIADPIADKALVLGALLVLWAEGTIPWWVPVVIIVREVGITLMRLAMVRRAVMAASNGGKLKTVLQFSFIIGYLVPWESLLPGAAADVVLGIIWWVMVIAVAVTVVTGLDYVVRAIRIAQAPRTP